MKRPVASDLQAPARIDWATLLVRFVTLIAVGVMMGPRLMAIYHFASDNPTLVLGVGLILFVGGLLGQDSRS